MGEENLLIIAKQLRERKNLSLAHIGVIVLFVDVEELGRALTDAHDGIFVLQGQDGMLEYVLNDTEGLMDEIGLRGKGYRMYYKIMIRYVAPVCMAAILISGLFMTL